MFTSIADDLHVIRLARVWNASEEWCCRFIMTMSCTSPRTCISR